MAGDVARSVGSLDALLAEDAVGVRVRVLLASAEFWDDDDGSRARAAEAWLRGCLDGVAEVLSARWGDAEVVELAPYLAAGLRGEDVPEPFGALSEVAGSVRVWRVGDGVRRLGLAIGQGDKELAMELVGVVYGEG